MAKFIILYTFDDVGDKSALKYLENSISSAVTECPNAQICLYTTTPEELIYLEGKWRECVKIHKYEPNNYGQKALRTTMNHFRHIGHARLYLIPDLLEKEQLPVIYLDNDTYISDGRALSDYITRIVDGVSAYCLEPLNFFYLYTHTFIQVDFRTDYEDVVCDGDIRVNFGVKCVNNGVQIFPNNDLSLNFAKRVLKVYEALYALDDTNHFNDMFAFSLVWHHYAQSSKTIAKYFDFPLDIYSLEYFLVGKKQPLPDFSYLQWKTPRDNPFIIHYCYQKYYNGAAIESIVGSELFAQLRDIPSTNSSSSSLIKKELKTGFAQNQDQRLMSPLIFYTFDHVGNRDSLNYLEASIISVILECPLDTEIQVYTTTMNELEYLGTKFSDRVKVIPYDPKAFGQKMLDISGDNGHFRCIGHARIYILPHLLEHYQKPIVYLDNDTYIADGKTLLNYANQDVIFGYCEEPMNFYYNCVHNFGKKGYTTNHDGIVIDDVLIDFSTKCINNGVQIYPPNERSLSWSQKIKTVYEGLCNLDNTNHWNDMFAFSAVWHHQKDHKDVVASCVYGFPVDLCWLEYLICYRKMTIQEALPKAAVPSDDSSGLDACVVHYCYPKVNNLKIINRIIDYHVQNYTVSQILSKPFTASL